jgi:hypothetical protein
MAIELLYGGTQTLGLMSGLPEHVFSFANK